MRKANRYYCDNCGSMCHPDHIRALTFGTIDAQGLYSVMHEQHYCDRCAEALLPPLMKGER